MRRSQSLTYVFLSPIYHKANLGNFATASQTLGIRYLGYILVVCKTVYSMTRARTLGNDCPQAVGNCCKVV